MNKALKLIAFLGLVGFGLGVIVDNSHCKEVVRFVVEVLDRV